jgi:tetratricopeptide (TPR) repeat protein
LGTCDFSELDTHGYKVAADAAPAVQPRELTAQQWFERGFAATDTDEEMRFYSEAIRLKPEFAKTFYNRGLAGGAKGDLEGADEDFKTAERLKPASGV